MPTFKVDFHHHCDCDPIDFLSYSDFELIDRLHDYGVQACAITPHRKVFYNPKAEEYAQSKGMLLISGVEKLIDGVEILLLNVRPEEIPDKMSFDDLKTLRQKKGNSLLTIAPHPFYPRESCIGSKLDQHADEIDAIEYAHLYVQGINFPNQQAVKWANAHQKPILANSDTHDLSMIGKNYSQVEAPALTPLDLFQAIRNNRVTFHSKPISFFELTHFIFKTVLYQSITRKLKGRSFN